MGVTFLLFMLKLSKRNLSYWKLKVIIWSKLKLNTFFWFKSSFEKTICSGMMHRYACSNYKATYYGETFYHSYVRVTEHLEILNHTGKHLKTVKRVCSIKNILRCNWAINFDEFDTLAICSNFLTFSGGIEMWHWTKMGK